MRAQVYAEVREDYKEFRERAAYGLRVEPKGAAITGKADQLPLLCEGQRWSPVMAGAD